MGVYLDLGASGTVEWCLVEDNHTTGIGGYGTSGIPASGEPSILSVVTSAVLNTRKAGAEFGDEGPQVFGDGVFAGYGSILSMDSVVVMNSGRAGVHYDESEGEISSTVITGSSSYGLALDQCAESVEYEGRVNYIFGNALDMSAEEAAEVTANPKGLPVPPAPEVWEVSFEPLEER